MRFEALVVDFGGVLTTPLQDSLELFAQEQGIELQDLARIALRAYAGGEDTLVTGFETGAISEEEFSIEFAQRLAQETGREVDPERLVRRLFGGMRLEEGMLDAVAKVRQNGLKTGLLSNSWGLDLYPRERFQALFDVVVISAEVGLRKPDPEIFRFTVEELGVAAERCIFVDDHPGHLKAALAEGMTTVLHRSPTQTIEELEGLLELSLTS
ncbi:MAG: HAD family phosphatase [Actinomycetota bacterium]|nr:HAD family phosphatase [Actinomycetota bacterium]